MNLFKKIKSLLPPSSRSFHSLYKEVLRMRDEMREMRNEMRNELHDSSQQIRDAINANDTHAQMLAFALAGDCEEGYEATRERFFKALPRATGTDRLIQLGCLQLMRDFDSYCRAHGLTYWMSSGTLIGAVRHEGFIPWDDDIDLGMMRSDVERLIDLVANDDCFMVTEVFDYFVTCRQIRFCYRDESIPCFLDLFLFDLSTVEPDEALNLIARDRARLKKALANDPRITTWNEENPLVKADAAEGAVIKNVFAKLVENAYSSSGYLTKDPTRAKSVIWAVDNFEGNTGRSHNFEYDTIFPVSEQPFEGYLFFAPSNPEMTLKTLYGNYLSLPKDIATHFAHVEKGLLDDSKTQNALGKLVERARASD